MTELNSELENIGPYNDHEAAEALSKVADHPAVAAVSRVVFPDEDADYLRRILKSIKTVDEFQMLVMNRAVEWVISSSTAGFSYDGIDNLTSLGRKFLLISNHRDIILDPAFTQFVLVKNNLPATEICVGDNLLSNKYIEYLIRSNRMIKVIRGINARTLYLSSMNLSGYIRKGIEEERTSIWLAQREGRAKNGLDTTEQGLLKMLDMSGENGFVDNFDALCIVPLSISYEYEPCDLFKARETLISRSQKYVKAPGEDVLSIITGIRQPKGRVHLNIGSRLTREEIEAASLCNKNDRYQYIRHAVDRRIISGYHLWPTNYMACDLLNGGDKYADKYSPEQLEAFRNYVSTQLSEAEPELDRNELEEIFLGIYANPVRGKEDLPDAG